MSEVRAKRSPSPDGQGIAKGRFERAWDAYEGAVRPFTDPIAKRLTPLLMPLARGATFDLLGFWVSWHMLGGYEGMQQHLGMSRSAVYRRITLFRKVFGEHPDVYRFHGISLDVEAFVQADTNTQHAD